MSKGKRQESLLASKEPDVIFKQPNQPCWFLPFSRFAAACKEEEKTFCFSAEGLQLDCQTTTEASGRQELL
ncbi:hypothetical protein M0638_15430 [Roseomonas sp. NAR14]|uniref:Uncharacterized protein n=1 Tax=Roseomonas acroporae TaxID=2937791 RepID=A0A9X1Y9W5_9PROT|nr:hypothetical protein [Roseomonas acroporae]MCK8785770.1 hypothetical protein [Roseomonas acroporae]